MIKLIKDTINEEDRKALAEWLLTDPQLTKGVLTEEFEKEFASWQGSRYSVFVNSGSSANLAALYALKLWRYKRKAEVKVVVPAVSWATTVAPVIQLGMKPIMCTASRNTLGIDPGALEEICRRENPQVLMLVHVLGIPADLSDIIDICDHYGVFLIEDTCEGMGSFYNQRKLGNFGIMGTFSLYYGHHITTIEGGLICTNNKELYDILKMIRAHGWARDLDKEKRKQLQESYFVNNFKELYTFYYPGFNIRATDLQAFIGLRQLKKLNTISYNRSVNLQHYDNNIKNDYWKLDLSRKNCFISNLAYPIITFRIEEAIRALRENNIETRPLVCGSMGWQPFWRDTMGEIKRFVFADIVDKYGLYVPNHPELAEGEIKFICNVINEAIVK